MSSVNLEHNFKVKDLLAGIISEYFKRILKPKTDIFWLFTTLEYSKGMETCLTYPINYTLSVTLAH